MDCNDSGGVDVHSTGQGTQPREPQKTYIRAPEWVHVLAISHITIKPSLRAPQSGARMIHVILHLGAASLTPSYKR